MKTEYDRYKETWGLNIYCNHSAGAVQHFSEYESKNYTQDVIMSLAAKKSPELQLVHIFFDSTTFDRVERDGSVSNLIFIVFFPHLVTMAAQLGLIGGTVGLFTGFSILSGIEMIYFAVKFLLSKMKCCRCNCKKGKDSLAKNLRKT